MDLTARTIAWIDADPDPQTRAELTQLLEAGAAELADRMDGTLHFGTAGLRGEVAAGSNRMNRAVVIRATRGVADWLRDEGLTGPVIVGFDARPSSAQFADDAVSVLLGAGLSVHRFTEVVPTPLVAWVAKDTNAAAAIVVTASHNPPQDNGYKVYAPNAAQIIPPVDTEISQRIASVGPANEVPMGGGEAVELDAHEVFDRYWREVNAVRPDPGNVEQIDVVYTPLHGVGGAFVLEALQRAGSVRVTPVAQQFEPDGAFPTVAFPNPEEKGALDLAYATASRTGASLVVANDPDADRLAAAVPDGAGWHGLTGNELGIILADHLLRASDAAKPLVVSSVVSTPMLGEVAAAHGARWERTLTGFKWISNAALALAEDDFEFVFGFEEALGYTVGGVVRDKDGISAAVVLTDLAAALATSGSSLTQRLAELRAAHGAWHSAQRSLLADGLDGQEVISSAMADLRHNPPRDVAGMAVTDVIDYASGARSRPPWLGATDLIELTLDGGRVLVRPSGTEPKLKVYADLRTADDGGDAAAEAASEVLKTLTG